MSCEFESRLFCPLFWCKLDFSNSKNEVFRTFLVQQVHFGHIWPLHTAWLGKQNPTIPIKTTRIWYVTGSYFMELSSLSYYFTVWHWLTASKKFELRSAGETVLQSLIDIVSFINVLFHGNNQFSRTYKHLNKCRITMKI